MSVPYRVNQMAALFVAAQKPRSFTNDFHFASSPGVQWNIIEGVVYCRNRHGHLYKVHTALIDYDPIVIWDGYQWRRPHELTPLEVVPVDFPLGMDSRYRWFIC